MAVAESPMYRDLARYYDLIYAGKNYRKEASLLRAVARKECRSRGRDLLDVGCGTGRHLEHLRRWYHCTGVDVSPTMLKIARKRLPDVSFAQGSMETFSLRARYDVVTLLFGVLGYSRTRARMERAIANLAGHLKPGGVLLVAAWYSPKMWDRRLMSGRIAEAPGVIIARVTRFSRPRSNLSQFEGHYLIGTPTRIQHVTESQELGLFRDEDVQRAFRNAGLRSHHIKKFWGSANGLHVGVRRTD